MSALSSTAFWETDEGLRCIAEFCRSHKGVPVKQAIERLRSHQDTDRRVEYFKGEKLLTSLLVDNSTSAHDDNRRHRGPYFAAKNVEEATLVCNALLRSGYIHRALRTGRGQLEFCETQRWEASGHFVWDFEGSKGFSHLLTGLLIVGMLTITCFPIWPHFLKVYLWYCSVTLLIFMFLFITLRTFLFLNFWVLGYEFWIFPNLFDESLSVIDSFKPSLSFEDGAPGQRFYRGAVVLALVAFMVYCYNQPTDFDSFITAQRDFVSDLYEGKLITDTSQQAKDDIDKIRRPSFEELAMEEEAATKANTAREEIDELNRNDIDSTDNYILEDVENEAAEDMIERMLNAEQ